MTIWIQKIPFKYAFLSGLLTGFAFPLWVDLPTGILAWFGLVPLLLSLRSMMSFKAIVKQGAVFLLFCVPICCQFVAYSGVQNWIFSDVSQSILLIFTFVFHAIIQKELGWRQSLYILPFLWTTFDWVQNLVPHSFQITSLAYTQTTVLWFAQCADIFGMWGITFWLLLVNVSIALTIDKIQNKTLQSTSGKTESNNTPLSILTVFVKKWVFQGVMLFGLPLLYAFGSNLNLPDESKIKVALVQTNEDSYAQLDSSGLNQSIERLINLSNEAAKQQPDIMVIPESALPMPILPNPVFMSTLCYYLDNWNASLALGFPDLPDTANPNCFYNSALVFTPQLARAWKDLKQPAAKLKVYRKQNPLPFMEYLPYADFLGLKQGLGVFGTEILRGSKPQIFLFPDHEDTEIKTAVTICWEQFFPITQAELVEQGAQFLCQMNNDGWFSNSTGQAILCNMNRLRAIENRRTVARCSNTGMTTFINPFGRFYGTKPPHTEAIAVNEVYLNSEITFFTQHSSWFPKVCGSIFVGLWAFWYGQKWRKMP
jgi:apolipoprotein N-acyltransferase